MCSVADGEPFLGGFGGIIELVSDAYVNVVLVRVRMSGHLCLGDDVDLALV